MKRVLILVIAIGLGGCANDQYTVIAGGPGSQANLNTDLHACKHQVLDAYSHANPPMPGGPGAIGGAVAGLIAASAASPGPHMGPSDINPAIEACMKEHGYVGTSEN